MRTSAKAKAKVKPTIVDAIIVEEPVSAWDTLKQDAANFAMDYDKASPTRRIATWVFSIAVSSLTYSGCMAATAYLVIAALALTGSVFLAMMVQILGVVLGVYFGLSAFSTTFNYVVSAKCTHHLALISGGMKSINRKVGGLFHRKEIAHA